MSAPATIDFVNVAGQRLPLDLGRLQEAAQRLAEERHGYWYQDADFALVLLSSEIRVPVETSQPCWQVVQRFYGAADGTTLGAGDSPVSAWLAAHRRLQAELEEIEAAEECTS